MRTRAVRLRSFLGVVSFALAVALAAPALAQCPLPDRLDGGPCWEPTEASLPEFPGFRQDAMLLCWANCNLAQRVEYVASWGQLRPAQTAVIPPLCSVFVARLDLADPASGQVHFTGPIRLWYSRTWLEATPDGRGELQVWRFLTNGDLRVLPDAGGTPCPVPRCAASFAGKVHFWGHLDVAVDCATGRRAIAWSLNHDCDAFHHAAGFPREGTFHPDHAYTFVGPGRSFVPSEAIPTESGSSLVEAVRPLDLIPKVTSVPPRGDICVFEEPIRTLDVRPVETFCPCGREAGRFLYARSSLGLSTTCGTTALSLVDTFPPGFISKPIGFWSDPARFPGPESLCVNLAGYLLEERCRPRPPERAIFFGVSTFRGFEAFQLTSDGPGAVLPPTFIDQANAMRFPGFTPVMNFKYVSDVVLNLNLP